MKAFQFRLDAVLKWRDRQFHAEEARLWQLLNREVEIEASATRLRLLHRAEMDRVCSKPSIEASELQNLAAFKVWARREGERLRLALEAARKEVAEQRRRTLEARRAYLLLEKLKETKWKVWNLAFDRELEADAADAFLSRWNRDTAERRAAQLVGEETI
jgi:hypothetical protein